ncbi:hypothetical protein [Actinokineospora sp. NBRC 105648]|uniref:hypothetical protein n=1 Tax=Actinokineospora sp. NBRC 105648 TaxID=3032206 RepID=UPI0025575B6D|nr:hypothetical protein [Actinokineospora sp. NBRC 105648]
MSSRTHRLVCDAQEAMARLDEIAAHSPFRSTWAWSVQLREIQRSAHLDRGHFALREVLFAHLPGFKRHDAERDLDRYLMATGIALGSSVETPDGVSAGQTVTLKRLRAWADTHETLATTAKVAIAHHHLLTAHAIHEDRGHVARLHVGMELARLGLLREQWLPVSAWIDRNLDEYRDHVVLASKTGQLEPLRRVLRPRRDGVLPLGDQAHHARGRTPPAPDSISALTQKQQDAGNSGLHAQHPDVQQPSSRRRVQDVGPRDPRRHRGSRRPRRARADRYIHLRPSVLPA